MLIPLPPAALPDIGQGRRLFGRGLDDRPCPLPEPVDFLEVDPSLPSEFGVDGEIHRFPEISAAAAVAGDQQGVDGGDALLRRLRDIDEGVVEALKQAAWRRAADRKDAQRFSDWSQRREAAEFQGLDPDAQLVARSMA